MYEFTYMNEIKIIDRIKIKIYYVGVKCIESMIQMYSYRKNFSSFVVVKSLQKKYQFERLKWW